MRPQITETRAWRLVCARFGTRTIRTIKARRLGSGLALRDAIASLARDSRRTLANRYATFSRVMQFEAGPETHTFYACAAHREKLERGDVMCFLKIRNKAVETVDFNDEIGCDFCREG